MLDQLGKEDQISGNRPSRCSPVLKQPLETKLSGFAVGEKEVEWVGVEEFLEKELFSDRVPNHIRNCTQNKYNEEEIFKTKYPGRGTVV